MAFLNAAFYHFTPLEDPSAWVARLRPGLESSGVKGTLILADEGLNGFLAGTDAGVRAALAQLRAEPPFFGLQAKESLSANLPFGKLCLKVKKEIVTFRGQSHDPRQATAPYLSPAELRQWFETGEDFLLLDTRNEYEFKLGAFAGARSLGIQQFVDFAIAAENAPAEWRERKIVTYCTGGIRCEKAAPFLRDLGFDAYQLEGGILNYFAQEGGQFWEGECFVFDQRVALSPELTPTGARLCAHCQGPVPASHDHCIHCGEA